MVEVSDEKSELVKILADSLASEGKTRGERMSATQLIAKAGSIIGEYSDAVSEKYFPADLIKGLVDGHYVERKGVEFVFL